MKSLTPICDRLDKQRAICEEALRTGTFGESLSRLNLSELNDLRKSFHVAVTCFLDRLDCEGAEFTRRNDLVGTAYNELLAAKRAKSA